MLTVKEAPGEGLPNACIATYPCKVGVYLMPDVLLNIIMAVDSWHFEHIFKVLKTFPFPKILLFLISCISCFI